MGWRFRGLYTVATAAARRRLTRDEIVAGTWAHITPADAPGASLPRAGLLVVHGFGPPSSHAHAPWDAFWPRTWLTPLPSPAGLLDLLDQEHRPPAQLIGWMHGFAHDTGLPIALYQCEMSGGLDLEIALVADPGGDTLTMREDRGTRQWRDGHRERARHDPLQTMLRALWARPDGWVFPPHERPMRNPLRPPAAVLRRTSLHAAARDGDGDAVRNLLARGADVAGYRWGLLEAAAAGGSADAVGRLAALGATGRDALAHAADADCAAELVEAGTDLGDALCGVVRRGYGGAARQLLALGATADAHRLWLSAAKGGIDWLISRGLAAGIDVDARANHPGLWRFPDGWSAIEWAAGAGHAPIVDRLLDAGATLTPVAVAAAARRGRVVALRTLLDRGGDPDATDDRGEPALPLAASAGHRDTVAMLLDAGARAEAPRGGSALHAACHSGRPDVVELLLDAAPGLIDAVTEYGMTPLWAAVGRGSQAVVDLLLARGADPSLDPGNGFTLRSYADRRGVRLPG
ncbi:ankyrin repeat domain-containing protein [Dactylosporangium sp. NBC_01737]|uniref:ankyrin repeat domain-containing protein n=1 Tax=Dactylosporangium sp. NBC_01737 TaxID=2975959 RepID=UPI002E0F9FA7|nr:ankyrin repeat domain-containing protein [Dactylosporangium sp. NBC_01737]